MKRHYYFISYIAEYGNISSVVSKSKNKIKDYTDIDQITKSVEQSKGYNNLVLLSINYLGKFKYRRKNK